jgi:hypothetical protein
MVVSRSADMAALDERADVTGIVSQNTIQANFCLIKSPQIPKASGKFNRDGRMPRVHRGGRFESRERTRMVAPIAPDMAALDERTSRARSEADYRTQYRVGFVQPTEHPQIVSLFDLETRILRVDCGCRLERSKRTGVIHSQPPDLAAFN